MSQAAVRWVETDGARSDHRPLPSPPPGWVSCKTLADYAPGSTPGGRLRKAQEIAREIAKRDRSLTCIVGRTAYVSPIAQWIETTVAVLLARARIGDADGTYRPPVAHEERWAQMSIHAREFCALRWRTWLRWKEICNQFKGRTLDERIAMLRNAMGAMFEALEEDFPSTDRTIRNWRKRCNPGDARNWDGGVGKVGRPTREALAVDFAEFWDRFSVYWLRPSRPSVAECYRRAVDDCVARGLPTPSYQTTLAERRRRYPDAVADLKRMGPREYQRNWETRMRRSYAHESRPGETWVCDFHKLDFWVVDSRGKLIRPYLCVFLDERSRKVMAWGIVERETSDNVIVIFARGVREHGAPLRVRCDNGRAFVAKTVGGKRSDAGKRRVESLFARLSVEVTWARPYNPGTKHVERFFRTVCDQFSKFVVTYAGNSPVNRPEELPKALKRGEVQAPSIEAIRVSFEQWAARYNSQPHTGDAMEGRSPDEVFSAENPIAKRTAPDDVLEVILSHRELVKVTREGIRFRGLSYPDRYRKLDQFRTKLVTIQVRLDNLSRIDVFDEAGNKHICDLEQRTGHKLTVDDVREAQSAKRAARNQLKAYFPASLTNRKSLERVAGEIAAKREARQAKKQPKRMAAGAESLMDEPRSIALIPGAAELAAGARRAAGAAKAATVPGWDDFASDGPEVSPPPTALQRMTAPPVDSGERLSDDLDDVWGGPEPDGSPLESLTGDALARAAQAATLDYDDIDPWSDAPAPSGTDPKGAA